LLVRARSSLTFWRILTVLLCLSWLQGSNCPHYDGELERKITDGYAVDDGEAVHFIKNRREQIVSSRPYAKAYRLQKLNGAVQETPLSLGYLGT